jgi:hypothetical protein
VGHPDTQGLPWPKGEPEAARAAARRAAALASSLQAVQGAVAATDAPGWSGVAAAAFDGAVQRDAAAIGSAAGAFEQAAGALTMVAGRLEAAQERVLHAARRLREARETAAVAAQRAGQARGAATSAHAAAALDPTAPLGSPLLVEAAAAEDAAQRAEAASAAAQAELARVERWAQNEAEDAVRDAHAADERAGGELQAASAGAGAAAMTTGTPSAALATGGGPLRNLGQYLNANLFNYWSGGPDHRYLPVGKMVRSSAFMYGTAKWMQAAGVAASWSRVAPGGPGTITGYAAELANSRLPVFNNGFLGKGLARGLSAIPATRGAGGWLSTASKATPFFRGLGVVGGGVSTVMDASNLVAQGNPVTAFKRDGSRYVADVARTGFSASSTAFLIAPNPVTGGAVIVTGTVWMGAEAWDHRAEIAHAASGAANWAWDHGGNWTWDHSLVGATWNHRADIAAAIDSGIGTAQAFADGVGSTLDHGVDIAGDVGGSALHAGGSALHTAGDVVDKLTPW